MAKFTSKPPPGSAAPRRDVSGIEVDAALSGAAQAAELPSALGIPIPVGAVSVPVPSLMALAVLEQIGSPFLGGGGGSLDTADTLRALYVLTETRAAAKTVAAALRMAAALDSAAAVAQRAPELWEAYLEAVGYGSRAWADFDAATAAFGVALGPCDPIDLAAAIGEQVALASRGYEMIPEPEGSDPPKAEAVSVSNGSASTPAPSTAPAG